jgi:hypothetical protein
VKNADRRALAELGAMLATCGLFLVFENVLHRKLQFLIPCAILWTAYVVQRLVRTPGLAREWGLRLDNLAAAAPPLLGVLVAGAAGMFVVHLACGGGAIPPGAWILFAVYPVWSFLQQFVLQVIVASNLERLGLARAATVAVASALFGLAHAPDWPLAALCAGAGVAWTALYLRRPHLPLLALTHAWLGTLAYYWVLQRNPWAELFPG